MTGVALIVALAAILWTRENTPLDHAALRSDPAFAIRMPGADELAEVGSDAQAGIDGSFAAFAGRVFGTMSPSSEVYRFYERELGRLGWYIDPPPYSMSTVEIENRSYCEKKVWFRLAINDKSKAFQPSFYNGRDYVTVFNATLIAVDAGAPCPRPLPNPEPTPRR
ncbi:MAG TPA: hypothetical protein VEP48_12345 [Methylomirabilota bacterium]|nr:hypothetical protein [Methylomirabilota bacterium]